MYIVTPMCIICLKSDSSSLNVIHTEMLTKLLCFAEEIEDFIPSIFVQPKMCNDCLNELNTAFCFKKMCLKSIVQFKDYRRQLEQVCNNCNPHTIMSVELTDINKRKRTLEVNVPLNSRLEQYSKVPSETPLIIKKEILEETYFKNYENDDSGKQNSDEELKRPSDNEDIIEDDLNNASTEVPHMGFVDMKQHKVINEPADAHVGQQFENVIIKSEILDESDLQPNGDSESQKHQSNEKVELLLHEEKLIDNFYDEEITDNFCDEELGNQSEVILEYVNCKSRELSEVVNNEKSLTNVHFTLNRNLIQHVDIPCENKSYYCEICHKSFTTKHTLKTHMLIHSQERQHSCSVCMKSFLLRHHLNEHMLIHTKERPHCCKICMKSFTQKGTLNQHMFMHSEEKPHFCTICGKTFTQRGALNQHMLMHSKVKPYSCSACTKTFNRKGSLKQHMLIHSEEKPHSCTVCMKSFNRKSNLNQHMLTHSKERPHSCPVCLQNFTLRHHLNQHMLSHSKERPHFSEYMNLVNDQI